MSRRRVLAAAAALVGIGAAGCAVGDGKTAGGPATAEPTVKLTYLHQWSPTQGHGPITDTLMARFKEQHPTIQVEGVYSNTYYEKITTMIAGGDLPDVATYNLAWVAALVKKGVVVPAESFSKGQYRIDKNDLVAGAREQATFEGKLAVTPYVVNNSGIIVNTSIYRQRGLDPTKPPATWDELVDQARRITATSGDKMIWGTVFPKGTADPISPLVAFIWQNGGDLVDMQKLAPLWNSQAAVEALQFQVDLVNKHRVAPYPTPANGEMGDVGIWHAPPGQVSALPLRIKDAFEWNTGVIPKGKQAATTIGGHSLAVLKTNKYHDQAWRFVHWWIQPPQNAEYLVASTTLPPWKATEKEAAWQKYLREEPRFKPFVDMLAYGRPTPKLVAWQEITDILVAARDDAGAQKKTPKDALDDAARAALPLIQQG